MITVSVPGKVHLMGEHAVVHGAPAFLTAIDKRLTVSITDAPEKTIWEPSDLPHEVRSYGNHILELIGREYGIFPVRPFSIRVTSAIPFGYHLGSSAAFAVALVGAVTYKLKKTWNPVAINKLAFEAEKFVHGNPSGGDNTAVTFGGWVWFRRELPHLKSIWQLPMKLPDTLQHFYLINTGKPEETTGEMVRLVSEKFKAQNSKFKNILSENEEQTRRIAQALKDGDEHIVVDAMQKGEQTLEAMGVVSDQVLPCIRAIEKSGGAAKILGGGGKKGAVGFLLAYHPHRDVLIACVDRFGYPVEPVQLGEEGIRLEKKS